MSQQQGLGPRRAALYMLDQVTGEGKLLPELIGEGALQHLSPEDRARAQRLTTETLRGLARAERPLSVRAGVNEAAAVEALIEMLTKVPSDHLKVVPFCRPRPRAAKRRELVDHREAAPQLAQVRRAIVAPNRVLHLLRLALAHFRRKRSRPPLHPVAHRREAGAECGSSLVVTGFSM